MKFTLVSAALICLMLSCAAPRRSTYVVYSQDAPPAPMDEEVPEAPGPEYVWVNGYWTWTGGRYLWVRGHWGYRPYPGWVWSRSGWVLVDGRYRFVAGYWVEPNRGVRIRYVHPAPAPVIRRGRVYRTVPRRRR